MKKVRILVFLSLLIYLLNPSRKIYEKQKPVLAIALDTSRSFELSGRLKEARNFLRKNFPRLAEEYEVKIYCFGDGVQEISFANLEKCPVFPRTAISEALRTIRRLNSDNLSAILLLSDGQENVDTSFSLEEVLKNEVGVPVNIVSFENISFRDIAIARLQYPETTFRNMPARVLMGVRINGFGPENVQVQLEKDDKVVQKKVVTAGGLKSYFEAEFVLDTSQTGNFNYAVRVLPGKGEISYQNNYQKFSLKVLREQLRVLYICGQPGYDYAFRRLVWKNNPGIDLVSFVILRNPENVTLVPDKDLSLIPFPAYDIFSKDLKRFDVLVIENFDFARFGVPRKHFENLVEWVRQGGGLLLIGGPKAFFGGGYNLTALADILPVEMVADAEQMIPGEFSVKPKNYNFPILQLSPDIKENIRIWENLPLLDTTQKLIPARDKKAEILLTHPTAVIAAKEVVVMAGSDFGRGRIVVFGSPTSFRWALGAETPQYYRVFWENVIRYLSHNEPGLVVLKDRQQVYEGQSVNFTVKPLVAISPKAKLEVSVFQPDRKLAMFKEEVARKGEEFFYQQQFLDRGRYLVKFILRDGRVIAQKETEVEVVPDYFLEEKNLETNSGLLFRLANVTQGRFYPGFPEELKLNTRQIKMRILQRRSYIPAEILFGIVVISLLGEWIYRRLYGLW